MGMPRRGTPAALRAGLLDGSTTKEKIMYDHELIRANLEDATIIIAGEHYAERRTLQMLMPTIRAAREKGISFGQLTEHFHSCGLAMDVMSVKAFYIDITLQETIERAIAINRKIEAFINGEIMPEPALPDGLSCLPLRNGIAPLDRRDGVHEAVYQDVMIEHPAIKGLMLTKDERLYGSHLEILNSNGQERFETALEKRFRIKWQSPIPMAKTSTSHQFVKFNIDVFKKGHA
jgi:hypothetical protein